MGIKTPMRCLIKFYLLSENLVKCELIYHHPTSLYTFVDYFFSIFMDIDSTDHHKRTRTLPRRARKALMQHNEVRCCLPALGAYLSKGLPQSSLASDNTTVTTLAGHRPIHIPSLGKVCHDSEA